MGFMSSRFPGHSRAGIPLHSRNVLTLLELWHDASTILVTIHFSQKRHASAANDSPDLHILTDDFTFV